MSPKLNFSQFCGRIRMTLAAWMNRVRRYRLPRFEMLPRIERPPVLYCRGTRPSQAPKSRPRSKASPVPIAATTAVEISGPTPGTLIRRMQLASFWLISSISPDDRLDALVEPEPVLIETDDQVAHPRRDLVFAVLQNREERVAQSSRARPHGDALLDEEGADLVDRRRPTGDQARAHAMASLQIELILGLLPHRSQVRSQRRLGDRLGVVVVVLLPLHERLHVDRRDDPRLVAELAQGAADEMSAEAGFHADHAGRQLAERLGRAPAA